MVEVPSLTRPKYITRLSVRPSWKIGSWTVIAAHSLVCVGCPWISLRPWVRTKAAVASTSPTRLNIGSLSVSYPSLSIGPIEISRFIRPVSVTGMQPSTPSSPGSPSPIGAVADPLPIPKPTAISQRSLGNSGVRKASHTVPVSPCHPPEYTTWPTADTTSLRSQQPAHSQSRFSASCSWPYPDFRLAFPGPLVTELSIAAPLQIGRAHV